MHNTNSLFAVDLVVLVHSVLRLLALDEPQSPPRRTGLSACRRVEPCYLVEIASLLLFVSRTEGLFCLAVAVQHTPTRLSSPRHPRRAWTRLRRARPTRMSASSSSTPRISRPRPSCIFPPSAHLAQT